MTDIAALSRLIENLIRLGTIAEVDHGSLTDQRPARVRVQSGALLTGWLPWLALRAGESREWDPPTLGEQVIVFSPSGQTAQGVVLCGLFSQLLLANADRAGLHRRTYPDGAVIEYDSEAHQLLATLPAGGRVQLNAPSGFKLQGDVDIDGLVTVSQDVVAAGISLVKHKHSGVQSGGAQTGAPV
ncbi:phage baseplate assembly protein V [Pseudomonas sp. CBMAI 2609]|uniref:Phage baseplate assembly protein V n=1 Tax=Pseudomonas flavocrustae TaxID=2991719 RepID=A0ABT6IEW5_9PSED|nr:phage baseplate assembly protein V [Pseudomonas sp. CBMAI 2609]MDH4763045.1 phage baseplate assembly protein V [Pseudomonas sp. CBMAI 2609]